ncbi:MAG: hypothetical protein WC346_17600 [Methanogenium sp.]|jgi:predicted chitinase
MNKIYSQTKFTISINYSLNDLKNVYKKYYGEKYFPKKRDIAIWISSLAESDVQALMTNVTKDEKN